MTRSNKNLSSSKKKQKEQASSERSFNDKLLEMQRKMIGPEIGFQASEAYKLLRANIMYTLPESECHIIGITSATRGEGKSMTAANLAYTLAEANNSVLLIDADMRIPTVAKRFNLTVGGLGLSDVLAKLVDWKHAIRNSELQRNLKVLTAGRIPPNPNELLASPMLEKILGELSEYFDYIILDLPPVNIVSDALVISNIVSGLIVVVRQNYSSQKELNSTVKRLEFMGNKVLGFVLTAVEDREKGYRYRKYRYGKYGKYGKYSKYSKYDKYTKYDKYAKYEQYKDYEDAQLEQQEKVNE